MSFRCILVDRTDGADDCSGRKAAKGEGRVVVQEQCELEEEMPKGVMCGLQGASGVIYADEVTVS